MTVAVGAVRLSVCPSPKSQSYFAIVPIGELDVDPSKVTVRPSTTAVNRAVGAWSGVTAISLGEIPTGMTVPGVFVAKVMGVTVPS